jgi:hypothetical protein
MLCISCHKYHGNTLLLVIRSEKIESHGIKSIDSKREIILLFETEQNDLKLEQEKPTSKTSLFKNVTDCLLRCWFEHFLGRHFVFSNWSSHLELAEICVLHDWTRHAEVSSMNYFAKRLHFFSNSQYLQSDIKLTWCCCSSIDGRRVTRVHSKRSGVFEVAAHISQDATEKPTNMHPATMFLVEKGCYWWPWRQNRPA